MISNNLEDYEVLSILGADLNSTCYKVRNKCTSEVFVWKAISYESFSEVERRAFLAQIEKQKLLDHPHLVRVHDYILHEETKIIYLISEFCANGNLSGLIHKCLIENEYLSEDFLWRVLYQIACALKIRDSLTSALNLSHIFVDGDYRIKLFNNDMLRPALRNGKAPDLWLGIIMLELCTLQLQKVKRNSIIVTKQILTGIPNYSNEFKEIIRFVFSDNYDMKAMVDAILCHPTILLKSTQVPKNIFVRNPITRSEQQHESATIDNATNAKIETVHQLRLENLKNRETALKVREERLAVKEHELHKRDKKLALMERTVKEKMLQAELYLKRCREVRSTSSGSSKNGPTKAKVMSYDQIDTSFSADCGDTSIVPTSRRMNPEVVKKPPHFSRTLSERRVQFKGHSPLKDMFSRNGSKERTLQPNMHATISETSATTALCKAETLPQKRSKSRKKLDLSLLLPARNRKPLVDRNVIHEETEGSTNKQTEYRPISWTEESKQHAFELLRIMNQNNENEPVKHTYL